MSHRIQTSVIAAVIAVALLAGCGGGGGGSNTTTSTTTVAAKTTHTSSSAAASAPTTSSNTTSSIPTNVGSLGSGAAVATYCQTLLATAKNLSSAERSQFKGYCASLAHDNPTQIKGAEKTLCYDVIKDTVPAAEQSLAKSECAKL